MYVDPDQKLRSVATGLSLHFFVKARLYSNLIKSKHIPSENSNSVPVSPGVISSDAPLTLILI